MKNKYVWLITANNLPIEIYEDQQTANSIAAKWDKNTSSDIQIYKIPFYKKLKKSVLEQIEEDT